MSGATFVTLSFNAIAAFAITPYAGTSVLGFALTALAMVTCGYLLWWRHSTVTRSFADVG